MKQQTIKSRIKDAENKILEADVSFYNDIKSRYFQNKKQCRTRRLVLIAGSAVAAIILIVCLSVFLPKNINNEVVYRLDNEVTVECDDSAFKNALTDIETNFNKDSTCIYNRIYDSVSNDDLYYSVRMNNVVTFEDVDLYFYINQNYSNKKKVSGEIIKDTTINEFKIDYSETISQDDDGFYNFHYCATLSDGNIEIYVEYIQLWYENSSNFFNFIEQTIKHK